MFKKKNAPILQVAQVKYRVTLDCTDGKSLQTALESNPSILEILGAWEQQKIQKEGLNPYTFVSGGFFEPTYYLPNIGPRVYDEMNEAGYPLEFSELLKSYIPNKPLLSALGVFFRKRRNSDEVLEGLRRKEEADRPMKALRLQEHQLYMQQVYANQKIAEFNHPYEELFPYPTFAIENMSAAYRDGSSSTSLQKLQDAWRTKKEKWEREKQQYFAEHPPASTGSRFSNRYRQ